MRMGGTPTQRDRPWASSGPTIVERRRRRFRRSGAARRTPALGDLIRRIYEVALVCSHCGGPMKIIAFITERKAIRATWHRD